MSLPFYYCGMTNESSISAQQAASALVCKLVYYITSKINEAL